MDSYKYLVQSIEESLMGQAKEISKDEYDRMKEAYETCLKLLWIEEKYNIFFQNYLEIEESIYNLYQRITESKDNLNQQHAIGQKEIINLNRLFANFLSSVRMYIDQVQHDLSSICNKEIKTLFKQETSIQYDKSIGYQIMEYLRNQMQHVGLFIEAVTIVRPLFMKESEFAQVFVEIDYEKIKKLEKFDQKIKSKECLENIKENEISVIPLVREYVEGLKYVHMKFREITKTILDEKNKYIYGLIENKYQIKEFGKIAFIKANMKNEYVDGVLVQQTYLKANLIKRREDLLISRSDYFMGKTACYTKGMTRIGNSEDIKIKYNLK